MSPRKSLLLSLKNVYETLRISVPTIADGIKGTISKEVSDKRLESWASHVAATSDLEALGRTDNSGADSRRPRSALRSFPGGGERA